MEQKEVKILKIFIPKGYEIDKEKSTFEKIVFKEKKDEVKNWDDLIGKKVPNGSMVISHSSSINEIVDYWTFDKSHDENIFIDKKHAKSALAMAQISQLMPYYGGAITNEEWENADINKWLIMRYNNNINTNSNRLAYFFLAFHSEEQRDEFLKNNEQLVKDYFMIE